MHLQTLDRNLDRLRSEFDRLDGSGQPTGLLVRQIARLQREREELANGLAILPAGRMRQISEQIVELILLS